MPATAAIPTQTVKAGASATIDRILASQEQFDPFIMADHFRMWGPTFGPHPHAGFSAVTYLFDDSETGFRNRDSLGSDLSIAPGSLHWTMAGRGVLHEEIPLEQGKVAHGLQMFVNLPASHKLVAPAIGHAAAGMMPNVALGAASGKLVFGSYQGTCGASIPSPGDATLVDITLKAHQVATLTLQPGQQGVLIVVAGNLTPPFVGKAHTLASAGDAVETVLVTVDAGATRVAWLFGTPWREPLVQRGPFGMSSDAQLQDAIARYQAGEMGHLAPL